MSESGRQVVYTIGHSIRTLQEFVELLNAQGVTMLVDVRTVPRSRRNPQFNRETLPISLEAEGIGYLHQAGLGGFRRATPDSPNAGWRNASFRGYADYMQTKEFAKNMAELVERALTQRQALMCAEAVPWRCHRSLISDALLARGIRVEEIVGVGRTQVRTLTAFAQVDGTKVTCPPLREPMTGESR
jgi:uncharacterized protein (DUF488 family)